MPLPDASRLPALPDAAWRALGERLHALEVIETYGRVLEGGTAYVDALARPLRLLRLRKEDDPRAHAVRCFVLEDPIAEAEARAMLGDVPLDALVEAGLLAREGGRVVSRFQLRFADRIFFFQDHLGQGGDAVMGLGRMTVPVARAAWPARPVERALDLGCGAGTCALLLADRARRVLATDINPRAVLLTRLNAALNGMANVEAREGDMYAPAQGERFDVVVSQPPFVPMPEGAAQTTYLFGGRRGDELPLRALRELPPVLAENGRAVFFVQWPVVEDDPIDARVRGAVADDALSVLLVHGPDTALDDGCISDAVHDHPGLGEPFERACLTARAHFDAQGIVALRDTLTVVARAGAPAWDGALAVGDLESCKLRGEHLDALLAAHALVARGKDALLAAKVRLVPGAAIAPRKGSSVLVFPDDWFLDRVLLDDDARALVAMLEESPTVRDASRRFAKQRGLSHTEALEPFLGAVAGALTSGAMRVAG